MTKQTLFKHLALGCTFMLGMTATLLAQPTSGTISGTVLDPSGALVPAAQVTISNSTGFSRTIKSNAIGTFNLRQLAPGSYSVSINASGFTPALDGVQVVSNNVTAEHITLGISVNQKIEVFAEKGDVRPGQGNSSNGTVNNY